MENASINPATGQIVDRYAHLADDELSRCLDRAMQAYRRHRRESFQLRAERMYRCAELLEERAPEYGRLMTIEMGKPLSQAVAEAKKCAWVCRYYARNAEAHLADERVETDARRSLVAYEPLGPVLAVMPWNFPFWQVFRFAAPALMAGNTALLKHASNVTGCGRAIEDVINEAGFDDGRFQTLVIDTRKVDGIIRDDRVSAATLTGSEGAGRKVGESAGNAIKPSVLELGSSDPFIVLSDADIDRAASVGVRARMQNNGQSCIAAKRFIVEEAVYDRFVDRYVAEVEALKVGDPMDEATDVGPIAREDLREELDDQVRRSRSDGATVAAGGRRIDGSGFFFEPTVLTDVEPGSVAFTEEIFGPVAAISRARDVDHAIELANDTPFGLGASVFTADRAKGELVARRLEVGCAFVNEMVKSDPRLPFGGVKRSGYGRELAGAGIREFVNVKTIWID